MGKKYNWGSDVWSLGCVLFELCALYPAFHGSNFEQIAERICNGRMPSLPSRIAYSRELHALCSEMLQRLPERRPSAETLLQRSILQGTLRSLPSEAWVESNPGSLVDISMDISEKGETLVKGDGQAERNEYGALGCTNLEPIRRSRIPQNVGTSSQSGALEALAIGISKGDGQLPSSPGASHSPPQSGSLRRSASAPGIPKRKRLPSPLGNCPSRGGQLTPPRAALSPGESSPRKHSRIHRGVSPCQPQRGSPELSRRAPSCTPPRSPGDVQKLNTMHPQPRKACRNAGMLIISNY